MSEAFGGSPGGYELTSALNGRAAQIVTTAIGRLEPSARTVAAKVVVAQFVQRCASAARAGDWPGVASWVDDACGRYGDVLSTEDVFGAALGSIEKAFEHSAGAVGALVFGQLQREIEFIAAKPHARRGSQRAEAVDEIDIVLDGLLTRLDQSDVLTAEHSRAVGSWCARLAKRMGSSKEEIVHLTRAGLVHDIGKVTTPKAILTAPRRLDDEEMAIMRLHAEEGARIVAGVPLLAHLAPAVRSHHERFDGDGYPDRLKWEAIPYVARIVAVADCFNAMIGRRPYRPPMPPSVALEQLVQGRGTQFDSDVVDAMIDLVTNRP